MNSTQKHTIASIQQFKTQQNKISAITAYDFPTAKIVNELNFPIVLVGDSASMVVYGYDNTTPINMEEMLLISRSVHRGIDRALIVGDMPFMSYQPSIELAIKNAGRFIKEGRVDAVKLEGGKEYINQISGIIQAGIPVMGHLGLQPQSILIDSGYRIHGKDVASALKIYKDALALEKAGIFALVLEGIPIELAELITQKLNIPTIGIGAGLMCDGQIQVLHDIIGLFGEETPKHAHTYINTKQLITENLKQYQEDVLNKQFPNSTHAKNMSSEQLKLFKKAIENI